MVVNNPNPDYVIMAAVKAVMLPNSKLAALDPTNTGGLGLVYIEDKYSMSKGPLPAAHLQSGVQSYQRNSLRTYEGQIVVEVCYYASWDQKKETIANVRKDIAADLEILKSNLENNEALAHGGLSYAVGIPKITLSPWKGAEDNTFPGKTAIRREMYLFINILPYDVLYTP